MKVILGEKQLKLKRRSNCIKKCNNVCRLKTASVSNCKHGLSHRLLTDETHINAREVAVLCQEKSVVIDSLYTQSIAVNMSICYVAQFCCTNFARFSLFKPLVISQAENRSVT